MNLTRITANIIILIIAGVWAYLSIKQGELVEISDNILYISVLIAGGEFAAAGDIASRFRGEKNGSDDNNQVRTGGPTDT